MEKNVRFGYLLDQYGPLLTQKQQTLLSMHVNEDLSLAEIAQILAQEQGTARVSRQAVHDALRRAGQQLEEMEERLGLVRRAFAAQALLNELEQELRAAELEQAKEQKLLEKLNALREQLLS